MLRSIGLNFFNFLQGKGYYIVAEAKAGYMIKSHLRKQLYKKNFKSLVTEMTGRIGILSIQGPKR